MDDSGDTGAGSLPCYERRMLLQGALSTGLGLLLAERTRAQDVEPRNARPQEGDRFIFATGDRKGATILPVDLPRGGSPVTAYPVDPHTAVVRDGSRLNQVLLIHLDLAELSEPTRAHAPQGIVAYSAVCTHEGCDVWLWQGEGKTLKCPCHDSEFDPKDGARVVTGPASRRLPTLPLKIVDGVLMAAGGFAGRVGFKQELEDWRSVGMEHRQLRSAAQPDLLGDRECRALDRRYAYWGQSLCHVGARPRGGYWHNQRLPSVSLE